MKSNELNFNALYDTVREEFCLEIEYVHYYLKIEKGDKNYLLKRHVSVIEWMKKSTYDDYNCTDDNGRKKLFKFVSFHNDIGDLELNIAIEKNKPIISFNQMKIGDHQINFFPDGKFFPIVLDLDPMGQYELCLDCTSLKEKDITVIINLNEKELSSCIKVYYLFTIKALIGKLFF